jgi:hypothetical protein
MSGRLEQAGRPYTTFNPSNRKHRTYYAEFLQKRTWGNCPVRFIVSEDAGDLVTMIQRELVKFYTEKEFQALVK